MNQPAQIVAIEPPRTWHMYRAMVGIGLVCGLLIVTVFQLTKPVIERKQAEALQRAIFQVLPEARSSKTFLFNGEERFEPLDGDTAETSGAQRIYAGYDAEDRLVGLAVEAQGMGYQDVIRVLYGYSFSADAIVGIRVLESKETPGLGDKIETDPEFLENFVRLDVTLSEDATGLAHPIEAVKHGEKEQPWQVDGITGASYWVPHIRRRLDDFREAG
jgi:electron transport complex protein RnfG